MLRYRLGVGVASMAILCALVACRTPDEGGPAGAGTQVGTTASSAVRGSSSPTGREVPADAPSTPPASTPTFEPVHAISASAVPPRGEAPLTVEFDGEAAGGPEQLHYRWDFGDGSAAVYHNKVRHTYVNPGEYAATLSISGPGGNQATSLPISVLAGDFACEIEADPDIGLAPLRVQFKVVLADDLPGPLSVHWDFGDSAIGTGNSVSHTYLVPGAFTATVAVTNGQGRTVQRDVPIQVDAPDD